ncbi:MAG: hypothetical protein U0637_03460 [Phycisphaerales bacterium]
MRESVIMLAVCGGVIAAGGAAAQPGELPVGPLQHVGPIFADRSVVPVYDATGTSCEWSSFPIGDGSSYLLEDVSFDPGPFGPSYTQDRVITQVSGMFATTGWTGTPVFPASGTPQCFVTQVFEFWDAGSFSAAPMLGNAVPFAVRAIPTNFGSEFAWRYVAALSPPVNVGTRTQVWVSIRAIDPSTGARMPDGNTALQQPAGQTSVLYRVDMGHAGPPCVGSTLPDYGRDQNPTSVFGGVFEGGPNFIVGSSPGSTNDRRRTAPDFASGARVLTLGLWGEYDGGEVPSPIQICPVNDGTTVRSITQTGGTEVQWYQLCLNAPVSDQLYRYLNIDTEGSPSPASLALYNVSGSLVGYDDGSGSGSNSQLTFGVGRGAGVGDGAQYDGRDGELPAGSYFLAVAAPGSTFSGAFQVTGAFHPAQTVSITLRTNATAGGNLPTLVAPVPNLADFTTPWSFPATDTLQGAAGPGQPDHGDAGSAALWTRFSLAEPGALDIGLDTRYLDVDAGAGTPEDTVLYLFNSAGDLLATHDDQVPGQFMLPLLSFGAANPARSAAAGQSRGAANAPDARWAGQTGPLPAGTYYLASAAWPTDTLTGPAGGLPTPGPNRRFHVRGLSPSSTPQTIHFYTGSGFNCDSIDFNTDGLFPDTADVDDFLSVFSGGPCSTGACSDIDFNNDGLFPDTLDIDAFLNVFSGGGCLR